MDGGLLLAEVDQLSQLLGECHLHDERAALAQAMLPVAAAAHSAGTCRLASSSSAVLSAAGPWADELMRRLHCCSSEEEGRAACAELIAGFHEHQQQRPLHEQMQQLHISAPGVAGPVPAADLAARLHTLQGANRVIVRALRVMSERQRTEASGRQRAEEKIEQLAADIEALKDQLHASERAKALLQSHLQVLVRNEQLEGSTVRSGC
mmetsp:Transcript_59163/g.105152  ORF Transcript_59163/g.105152 Transcript_59163/m.105152 type:complete len:208 (+) Transcript_59163:65-688(+)